MTYYIVHYLLFYFTFRVALPQYKFSGVGYYLLFSVITIVLLYGVDKLFNMKALHWMIGK